jgi:hypothetical protein
MGLVGYDRDRERERDCILKFCFNRRVCLQMVIDGVKCFFL